jgi:hypothetical protein
MPQELPQRPQFWLSLVKSAMLLHWPMHDSYPAAQLHEPPVQDWLNEQLLPQRPQFWLSLRNMNESTQRP